MANLTVNNNTYSYPDPGTEPGWGSEATGWAADVTDVLNSLSGAGTISETESSIEVTATDKEVAGLVFNSSIVEAADITYRLYRKTDSAEYSEKGTLSIVYKPGDVNKWVVSRVINAGDDALVTFDIDNTGQVTYSSSLIAGSNYSGFIRFKTITILKT